MERQQRLPERQRRVLETFGDAELLAFHAIGGAVPEALRGRLNGMRASIIAEAAKPTPKRVPPEERPDERRRNARIKV